MEANEKKRMALSQTPDGRVRITAYDVVIAYIPAGFEHSDANAALIAAAPVILEALNHALAVCEAEAELRGENDTDDYQGGAAGPVAEMIRAAIALAAGKS